MDHDARIRDQFTRQAVPFSEAPSMRDEAAIALLVEAAAVGPGGRSLDVGCGPGLGTVRRDGRVLFHYPAVVLAAAVPEERP